MNSWKHAVTAAKEFGGSPSDYIAIENFIDSSKQIIGDVRHRSMYHHTAGIWLCQTVFGTTIDVPGKVPGNTIQVPVRLIAEKHVLEDLGWLPSPHDYINNMTLRPWMGGPVRRKISRESLHLAAPQPNQEVTT